VWQSALTGIGIGVVVSVPLVLLLWGVWVSTGSTSTRGSATTPDWAGRPRPGLAQRRRLGLLVVDGEVTVRYEMAPAKEWPRYFRN